MKEIDLDLIIKDMREMQERLNKRHERNQELIRLLTKKADPESTVLEEINADNCEKADHS